MAIVELNVYNTILYSRLICQRFPHFMGRRLLVKYQDKLLSEISPEIPLNGIITVGNDVSATIELKDDSIAPEQFVIICEPNEIILMCRVDGTIINGKTAPQGTIHNLQNSDLIVIGDYNFSLESDEIAIPNSPEPELSPDLASPDLASVEVSENKNERTLTDVLKSLRAEEKFYFQIESEDGENRRLFIETDDVLLGRTAQDVYVLTTNEDEIEAPSVQIKKDWSGVVVYPLQSGKVWLDKKILTEPYRLKNDDRLYLQARNSAKPDLKTVIRFHEPTALLVLDSILPKELPPPISLDETENRVLETEEDDADLHTSQIPAKVKMRPKKLLFGYFTLTEIIIMIVGTLITAGIIFLILEFY